jgi:phytoene desaturase
MDRKKKIAVIGAGLGGMSAAIRLVHHNAEVHVHERISLPGGKAGELYGNGFRFDTGPSLLTMPFVIDELFLNAGEHRPDYLPLEPLSVLCKYFFPDGLVLHAYADIGRFADEIGLHTADSPKNLFRYLTYCKKIYDRTADLFLFNRFGFHTGQLRRKAFDTLVHLREIDPFRSMHTANRTFFRDPRTVQLFDRYATYNGSNPYKAPATLNIIQHVEYNLGGYYSPSGMYALPQALKRLAEKVGVIFHFNSPVDKILLTNGKINGISAHNDKIPYDVVVSNADVLTTYDTLLHDRSSRYAKRYRKLEPSSSALVFYWGIRGTHPILETHNIIFSADYKQEFHSLFKLRTYHSDPTVYIYISSRFSSTDAPESCENWFVMINAPFVTSPTTAEVIDVMRESILQKIETTLGLRIRDDIIFEQVLTPSDIARRTGGSYGSIYGISSNSRMAAFLRQPNRSMKYKGLYFCGGSAHPGGGIPLVLMSGKIAAEMIYKHELHFKKS